MVRAVGTPDLFVECTVGSIGRHWQTAAPYKGARGETETRRAASSLAIVVDASSS